ncbi:unnamed protein product [Cyprideis torosa]|uniref:Uncharacterized protein n=1 Tax=Cyprideis torosa TaxID=163714 RepID=A0A7R8W561_9CRUS|nr:unnamed protein product [Cyprideis torosa]CAG0883924.1 unnamed protein product [Cyprideis torosa]
MNFVFFFVTIGTSLFLFSHADPLISPQSVGDADRIVIEGGAFESLEDLSDEEILSSTPRQEFGITAQEIPSHVEFPSTVDPRTRIIITKSVVSTSSSAPNSKFSLKKKAETKNNSTEEDNKPLTWPFYSDFSRNTSLDKIISSIEKIDKEKKKPVLPEVDKYSDDIFNEVVQIDNRLSRAFQRVASARKKEAQQPKKKKITRTRRPVAGYRSKEVIERESSTKTPTTTSENPNVRGSGNQVQGRAAFRGPSSTIIRSRHSGRVRSTTTPRPAEDQPESTDDPESANEIQTSRRRRRPTKTTRNVSSANDIPQTTRRRRRPQTQRGLQASPSEIIPQEIRRPARRVRGRTGRTIERRSNEVEPDSLGSSSIPPESAFVGDGPPQEFMGGKLVGATADNDLAVTPPEANQRVPNRRARILRAQVERQNRPTVQRVRRPPPPKEEGNSTVTTAPPQRRSRRPVNRTATQNTVIVTRQRRPTRTRRPSTTATDDAEVSPAPDAAASEGGEAATEPPVVTRRRVPHPRRIPANTQLVQPDTKPVVHLRRGFVRFRRPEGARVEPVKREPIRREPNSDPGHGQGMSREILRSVYVRRRGRTQNANEVQTDEKKETEPPTPPPVPETDPPAPATTIEEIDERFRKELFMPTPIPFELNIKTDIHTSAPDISDIFNFAETTTLSTTTSTTTPTPSTPAPETSTSIRRRVRVQQGPRRRVPNQRRPQQEPSTGQQPRIRQRVRRPRPEDTNNPSDLNEIREEDAKSERQDVSNFTPAIPPGLNARPVDEVPKTPRRGFSPRPSPGLNARPVSSPEDSQGTQEGEIDGIRGLQYVSTSNFRDGKSSDLEEAEQPPSRNEDNQKPPTGPPSFSSQPTFTKQEPEPPTTHSHEGIGHDEDLTLLLNPLPLDFLFTPETNEEEERGERPTSRNPAIDPRSLNAAPGFPTLSPGNFGFNSGVNSVRNFAPLSPSFESLEPEVSAFRPIDAISDPEDSGIPLGSTRGVTFGGTSFTPVFRDSTPPRRFNFPGANVQITRSRPQAFQSTNPRAPRLSSVPEAPRLSPQGIRFSSPPPPQAPRLSPQQNPTFTQDPRFSDVQFGSSPTPRRPLIPEPFDPFQGRTPVF